MLIFKDCIPNFTINISKNAYIITIIKEASKTLLTVYKSLFKSKEQRTLKNVIGKMIEHIIKAPYWLINLSKPEDCLK